MRDLLDLIAEELAAEYVRLVRAAAEPQEAEEGQTHSPAAGSRRRQR